MMNINSSLVNELMQKDYRNAYVASQIRIGLPFQIRALRTQRGWNQEEFARHIGMSQPRVSEMERPGERRLTIETLLRIAAALDIGLQIRFISFGDLVEWAEDFSPDNFRVPSFEKDPAFKVSHLPDREIEKPKGISKGSSLPSLPMNRVDQKGRQQNISQMDSYRQRTLMSSITDTMSPFKEQSNDSDMLFPVAR